MHHRRLTFAGLLALGLIFVLAAPQAHEYRVGAIRIDHPWARATPGAAPIGAAFVTLVNEGPADDRLVGAETPVAERVEIHRHVEDGGVMRMRAVEGGLDLPAGGTAVFAPGALHLMLVGLTRPLQEGEQVPMTLTFEQAGTIEVELAVEGIAALDGHDHGS